MTEPLIYKVERGNVLHSWTDTSHGYPINREDRAPNKPFYVCQGIACHDQECPSQTLRCDIALAMNMVRAGLPDGMMLTPSQYYHCHQSIHRLEEWQRSPKLPFNHEADIMRRWIREYGDTGIRLEYMAYKQRGGSRHHREYYVSLTNTGARFTFLMLWHGKSNTDLPHIRWPDDWQLNTLSD